MKHVAVVLVLCGLAAFCGKDTESGGGWRRIEPRLSGAKWRPCRRTALWGDRVIAWTACGNAPDQPPQRASCGEIITTPAQAYEQLAAKPFCTEPAITILERRAKANPAQWSDVAAAYYVRAQYEDSPADLLRSLEAAKRAVDATPQSAAARFNLALAQEALGLTEDAIASWDKTRLLDHSEWGAEALGHLADLRRQMATDDETRWRSIEGKLPSVLATGDVAAVTRLIDRFPLSAEDYLEKTVLPEWAKTQSPEMLARARTLAAALSRRNGDPFAADVVGAIDSARTPGQLQALRDGLQEYASPRPLGQAASGKAAQLLGRAGNPLQLVARVRDAAGAKLVFDALEREARQRKYEHLVARIQAFRAVSLDQEGDFVQALRQNKEALRTFIRLRDPESEARVRVRRSGGFRELGDYEGALHEFLAIRAADLPVKRLIERHLAKGEAAQAAMTLNSPTAALAYQRDILRMIQRDLRATRPEDITDRQDILTHLSIARRELAGLELRFGEDDAARLELQEALRLLELQNDDYSLANQRKLRERMSLMEGRMWLNRDPRRAVAAFSDALARSDEEAPSFRAGILAQRSDVLRSSGRTGEAEADLVAALKILRDEESGILRTRRAGEDDLYWRSYFGRLSDVSQRVMRQLVQEGKPEEAFLYAERFRAYEPLDLILQRSFVPRAFRDLVPKGEPVTIQQVQKLLPPGTFLVEYAVLDEQTLAWIVSREARDLVPLPAGGTEIHAWMTAIQAAAASPYRPSPNIDLETPYEKLVAEPLRRIRAMPGGADPHLVIVPDADLHGLPFAALRERNSGQYLIEQAEISIAGSATLYLFALLRDRQLRATPGTSTLLVGNPTLDLPAAGEEVDSIKREVYPDADVRKESQATVAEVLRLAPAADILHFACHAIAYPRAPWQSELRLAPSSDDSGDLTAQRLVTQLTLPHTRLVALSSCTSAGGYPVGPQGVGPLVRPFIASGVPGVVGSLWDVEDATAEELLVSFHQAYRQGSDAAAALRQAQLEALRKDRHNVLAWAAFEVIGHASSPFPPAQAEKEKPP